MGRGGRKPDRQQKEIDYCTRSALVLNETSMQWTKVIYSYETNAVTYGTHRQQVDNFF